jgi:SulP family sulfate permease
VTAVDTTPPDVSHVKLDDLVPDDPAQARPRQAAPPPPEESLALAPAAPARSAGQHLRQFFAGSFPVNVLAGLVGGAHIALVSLALATLFLTLGQASGLIGQSLPLLLAPAVFGTLLLAFNGRLPVALCAPDPSAVLTVSLLLGAVGAELAGRATPVEAAATLAAALALCALLPGVLGLLFSRLGVAERVRFLPGEMLGGMLSGFGLLLIAAWARVMAAANPALAGIAAAPAGGLLRAIADSWAAWAPTVGFALLYFLVHMSVRGLLWPLLVAALAVGGWHALMLAGPSLPGPVAHIAASLAAAQPPLPNFLDLRACLGLYDPHVFAGVRWEAILARPDFLAAAAVIAILPSLVRAPILETVLGRDADHGGQMRLLGAASLLSGALGGMPSALSLSTSLGVRALGAAGPIAGVTAAGLCLAGLFGGAAAFALIPPFVPLGLLLATGLIVPVSWMLRDARNPLTRKDDLRAAWASCLLVVILGPAVGVLASLVIGLGVSLSRAAVGCGVRFSQTGDVYHSNVDRSPEERALLRRLGGSILVLRLQNFLFLGTLYELAERIRARMDDASGQGLRFVLLDMGAVRGIGASAATGFRRLESLAREGGLTLFITSVPLEMEEHLEGLGYRLDDASGVCRVALNLDYALETCEEALLAEAAELAAQKARESAQGEPSLPPGLLDDAPPADDAGSGGDAPVRKPQTLAELLAGSFPEPMLVPALMKCLERVEAPRKTRIVVQGDASDAMYFLESGKVQAELALPGGKLLRLKKMGPGTLFGEMGIYTSAPRSATVVAVERCVLYRLSLERFRLIQAKAPSLAAAVNRYVVALLAERVAEANALNRATQQQ